MSELLTFSSHWFPFYKYLCFVKGLENRISRERVRNLKKEITLFNVEKKSKSNLLQQQQQK